MSNIYDNWERLVAAVIKREQIRQLCYCDSLSSSFNSLSSDFSFRLSGRFSSSSNRSLDGLPVLPTNPYDSGGGIAGAASRVVATAANKLPRGLFPRRKQQKQSFITGVPKLSRYELEAACEDFSNIVMGSTSTCILYKGTLSSYLSENRQEVEIEVAHIPIASAKRWSDSLETQFRMKVNTLSLLNHKNFINLLGYCSEEKPFTRMMVFEYAPNGTLFEYLHVKEVERLDWAARLRIAMGIAYCLEIIHHSIPAFAARNLTSSAVYLTEDYAAKLSDFFYMHEVVKPNLQENVYCFGTLLFEMMTGHIPPLDDSWLSDYHRGVKSLVDMIDPTLKTYEQDQLEQIGGVIKSCTDPVPRLRPRMSEVCERLREITAIEPDGASPKILQPLRSEIDSLNTIGKLVIDEL